jgi:histidine triad (HIT) family protein
MPSYDPNNIFAKILRSELPAYKVYEDDKAVAFLDIMPQATGHTLVVPKSPARTILDIGPDDLAHAIKVAQKIAKAAVPVFAADGLTIIQFNEPASGQTVFHLHIHVIPRKNGVPLRPHGSFKEERLSGPGGQARRCAQGRVTVIARKAEFSPSARARRARSRRGPGAPPCRGDCRRARL